MKKFNWGDMFISALIGAGIITIIIIILSNFSDSNEKIRMQKRAVESNLGHYDTKTADWKWNTPELKFTITGKKE